MNTKYSSIPTTISQSGTEPNQLYTQITPEKSAALAEERIFVYMPKVTMNNAGIAKFVPSQFTIINGEVSVHPQYIEYLRSTLASSDILASPEEPTDAQIWLKEV